jgi:hypothetical protein
VSNEEREHPVTVAGYEGSIQDLAKAVMRLRYDVVKVFFAACVQELARQGIADHTRGRQQLAAQLFLVASLVGGVSRAFEKIFHLCRPHLAGELSKHPEQ